LGGATFWERTDPSRIDKMLVAAAGFGEESFRKDAWTNGVVSAWAFRSRPG